MDAMAHRLPVVASRVGGIPEVVIHGKTGVLVPPRKPSALAEAILTFYNDHSMAELYGQRGYEVVHKKFSAESMAGKIIAIYERQARNKGVVLASAGETKNGVDEVPVSSFCEFQREGTCRKI